MDIVHLREWIGREESAADEITPAQAALLAATLDRSDPEPRNGDLPPLWHWLYFLPRHRLSDLAPDGHARRGGFLPPVPLAHRMWAGGRFEFHRPLRIGDRVTRTSRIEDVILKQGRSGALVFVTVHHEIRNEEGVALTEEQDIVYRDSARVYRDSVSVYRDAAGAVPPPAAPGGEDWEREIRPGDVLLFRYSALTFNSHRIHYDRRFATNVEGYPGLVVHGPLIATLLLDLLRCNLPEADVAKFSFRAVSPLFDTAPFRICGKPDGDTIRLWAKTENGNLAMDATATLRAES
ncbi:MAG TPA: MaoC family dehydratase N-terminal domain-containing protein [Bryobacteraceae bacterium]